MQNQKVKILYVEDDVTLSYVTKDNLEENGYQVICSPDGRDALTKFKTDDFDLCIFDVMLPEIDGFTLAKNVREINREVPIIFLTAKSMKEDRIAGLKTGADDYITKPFSIEELCLKINIFLKRNKINENTEHGEIIYNIGRYKFNHRDLQLTHNETTYKLTHREADILKLFCLNNNKLIERETILNEVWGKNDYFSGRSLDVFISKLRKYLNKDSNIRLENVHGIGFKLLF